MDLQHVSNQKAEIDFRKKLYLQQVHGQQVLDDEFDSAEMQKILAERMNKTLTHMAALQDRGIPLSPYIEIGAERGQRSLVMENDLGAAGCAVDISYDLLKSCHYYQQAFAKSKIPLRICCDVHNLPFKSDSIPFVFCYETLHHFPNPEPVVQELYRVLAPGGFFFFDEEPYKRILHLNLYSTEKIYSEKSLRRSMLRKVLDRFFAHPVCNEVEHGVIENHDIPLSQWKQTLACFGEKDVRLKPTQHLKLESELFNPRSFLKYALVYLLGGTVSGVCKKSGNAVADGRSLSESFICPTCRQKGEQNSLRPRRGHFLCTACSRVYPVADDIVFLFAHHKMAELYPEILDSYVGAARNPALSSR